MFPIQFFKENDDFYVFKCQARDHYTFITKSRMVTKEDEHCQPCKIIQSNYFHFTEGEVWFRTLLQGSLLFVIQPLIPEMMAFKADKERLKRLKKERNLTYIGLGKWDDNNQVAALLWKLR